MKFKSIPTLISFAISICATPYAAAQIAPYTQMSLSSDGKLIALGYVDKNKNEVVDIAKLADMPNLKARRLSLGKVQAFTIAFGIDPESLLITTRGETKHDLLRVNVANLIAQKLTNCIHILSGCASPKKWMAIRLFFWSRSTGKMVSVVGE